LNLSAIIFAGGTAGVAMWTLAIPPDVCPSVIHPTTMDNFGPRS
jgi:solute carrier family 25 carnitine/acylcarnitine transporter 20/29